MLEVAGWRGRGLKKLEGAEMMAVLEVEVVVLHDPANLIVMPCLIVVDRGLRVQA